MCSNPGWQTNCLASFQSLPKAQKATHRAISSFDGRGVWPVWSMGCGVVLVFFGLRDLKKNDQLMFKPRICRCLREIATWSMTCIPNSQVSDFVGADVRQQREDARGTHGSFLTFCKDWKEVQGVSGNRNSKESDNLLKTRLICLLVTKIQLH